MKRLTVLLLLAATLAGSSSRADRPTDPPPGWSERVAALLAAGEYGIAGEVEGELQAVNRRQDLRVRFHPQGVSISRRTDGSSAVRMSFLGGGPIGSEGRVPRGRLAAQGRVALRQGEGRSERWDNRESGLLVRVQLPWPAGLATGEVRFDLDAPGGAMAGSPGNAIALLDEAGVVGRLSLRRVIDGRGALAGADLLLEGSALVVRFRIDEVPAAGSLPSPLPEEIPLPVVSPEDDGTVTIEMILEGAAAEAVFEPTLAWQATFVSDDTPAIAAAGDVNGDGFDDVIVGSDAAASNAGEVALYLGNANGLQDAPAWQFFGTQSGAKLGAAVAGAGDVNGDGFDDVLVGAPLHDGGSGLNVGRALLFLGSPSGPSTTPSWEVLGASPADQLGTSVGLADVNGDGYDDVIAGAPFVNSPLVDQGVAYLFAGGPGGPPSTPSWVVQGDQGAERFGSSVGATDVDSDGYEDLLVGAPFYDRNLFNNGRVLLFPGGPAGPSTTPSWTVNGHAANVHLGTSLDSAGDVNGDGFADVIVGAPDSTSGRVSVYAGSAVGLSTTRLWTRSETSSSQLGASVAGAGDVDGDGRGDILVGEPREGSLDRGVAYLYSGSSSGPSVLADWSATIPDGNWFGAGVAAAGDVNDDGFADYLIAAPRRFGSTGEVVLYLGGAWAPADAPSWTAAGTQPLESLGISVASAGDVNGDGFSDVVVGASLYDGGQADEGRALLYLGGEAGISDLPAWTDEPDRAGAFFGASVAPAGDVDGDGHDDVIVGARGSEFVGDLPGGMAVLYRGTPDGLEPAPSWMQEEMQPGAAYGQVVASAGDVNGDGFADVLVGAHLWDGDLADEGKVWVYLGSGAGLSGAAAWSAEGNQAGARFGVSAASAGDVNGDALDDLVVGAYRFDGALADAGRVMLFSGSATGPSPEPTWLADGEEAGGSFGFSVGGAGDVNGDGFADLLVGALQQGGNQRGRAFAYLGSPSGPSALPDTIIVGIQSGGWLGNAVAAAGDVNADGFDDVLIGSRLHDGPLTDQGLVQLHLGSASGLAILPAWMHVGDDQQGYLGISVAAAGDVNGDGFDDFIAGASGAAGGEASIWLGTRRAGVVRAPAQRRIDGTPLPAGALLDEDGRFRVRTNACSPAGRVALRLEWQVAPAGEPFGGSPLRSVPIDRGPSGPCVPLDELVTVDVPGTGLHWRARVASDDLQFRASPWLSPPGRSATASHVRTPGCLDRDGDGFGRPGSLECPQIPTDCEDLDAAVYPGAPQLCDGVANDCADPSWPAVSGEADADGDGVRICAGDCDDRDAAIAPGLPELCDGLDNDCDGTADAFATVCGVGECASTGACLAGVDSCIAGSPTAEECNGLDDDCDGTVDGFATACGVGECASTGMCLAGFDSCAAGAPGVEICNGLDDDCDGSVPFDEADGDHDGYLVCEGDCNDGNALAYPGATELCDDVDNDCDGAVDGFPTSCGVGECASTGECLGGVNNCVPIGYSPESCDGLDNDCDGVVDSYVTSCGVGACERIGFCLNGQDSCRPGAPQAEACDGLDNDCDGTVPPSESDADADGYRICQGDCADGDPGRFPGNPELCDAVDNDCDLVVDGFATFCGVGACAAAGVCENGADSCTPGLPAEEVCDGLDNDCDGALPGPEIDVDLDGVSECAGDCAPLSPVTYPDAPEVNDGLDNQCPGDFGSGSVDEISGTTTFVNAAIFCWPAQGGATGYRVIRIDIPDEDGICAGFTTVGTCVADTTDPAVGSARGYLAGADTPLLGSLGQGSDGVERHPCAAETTCDDGVDGDADGKIDCADPDCFDAPECPAALFRFTDTVGDDIADTALLEFFVLAPVPPGSFLRFSMSAGAGLGPFEWCSDNATALRDFYLALAPTAGAAVPAGQLWYRETDPDWSGPFPSVYTNLYGAQCLFGRPYSWCSTFGLAGRALTVDPASAVGEATDALYGSLPQEFTLTIAVGPDRMSACGF